ncbi:hypothetical protein TNCV_4501371 [Trichonephila clavipes]|nr:hypothetical protein TNCV_4501371 [Trichonephila clavipes]
MVQNTGIRYTGIAIPTSDEEVQAKTKNLLKSLPKPRSRTVTSNGSTECRIGRKDKQYILYRVAGLGGEIKVPLDRYRFFGC